MLYLLKYRVDEFFLISYKLVINEFALKFPEAKCAQVSKFSLLHCQK